MDRITIPIIEEKVEVRDYPNLERIGKYLSEKYFNDESEMMDEEYESEDERFARRADDDANRAKEL
jgi:hypothetical protein